MKNHRSNRRSFLKASSLAASSFLYIPASVLGRENRIAANDRINVGCIGIGPQGTGDMRGFLRNPQCQVVALCDLKSNVLQEKQNLVNEFYSNQDCMAYHDFRDLTARGDIDACLVATCDHWHVLTSLAAVRSGKDVYMEKPMGLTLEEDQAMRAAVNQHNRIFQFGTQQRSDPLFRKACEIVRNGLIGDLHTIHVWSPGSSQGGSPAQVPVPEWLDYDFWLGPSKFTPYTENRCSNELWWFISDYALGFIAGWGIHPIDIALWGAEDYFQGTWEIEGRGKFPGEGVCDTALTWDVKIQIEGGVTVDSRGDASAAEWKKRYSDDSSHGTAFEGTEGWVYVRRGKIDASPKNLLDARIERPLYESSNHVDNFLECVRSRKETICPVGAAVKGDALCHISDIAIRREEKLLFDSQREVFIGNHEANKRLMRPMRKPWRL
ncbi:MAG: Gfo/Idh/MocA family oxidoreductase [Candidatus Omnitrophica bacterium]|nr:Gfo/Idh/MocA family oxidoreductase [Candidatus Omnitrophota bacterium]